MPLDDLVSVIETLQQRIREHGDSLRQNEIRTRVVLIDPLLTALGWDVSDPGLVTAEYDVSGRRADYALLGTGAIPAATLEAKKLGESLDSHRLQMLNYSNAAGIRFAGLTDGNRWELYEIFKQGTLDERRILEAVISSESPAYLALKFLLLWRPNLGSGRPVVAPEPVLVPSGSATGEEIPTQTPQPIPPEGWVSLAGFAPGVKQPPPPMIRLPNGEEKPIKHWNNVLIETAEYLVKTGKLTANSCPVPAGHGGFRYVVHHTPIHSNGKEFTHLRNLSNGLCCEVNANARTLIFNTTTLLNHYGQDPSQVQLKVR